MSPRTRHRAWWASIAVLAPVCACLVVVGLLNTPRSSEATPPLPPAVGKLGHRFPRLGRVAVLVLENREYRAVIGAGQGRYLSGLARRYSLATHYYAVGHPSLPNYLAMTAGSTFGIESDCNGCDFEGANLLTQLDGAGISWKAYFESLPRTGYLGTRHGRYSKHLNPFVYYETLKDKATARARIVPLRRLGPDIRGHRLPRFAWIAPNLCHDSHYCPVGTSDRYAAHLVPRVLHALGPRGVLFLTWDEGTTHLGAHGLEGGGHIPLITAGPAARRGATFDRTVEHYSLLRTIEAGYRLPALGQAGASSTPLLTGMLR